MNVLLARQPPRMNHREKVYLREGLAKPGRVKSLLTRLPMTPWTMSGTDYKWIVWFARLSSFDPVDMAQLYYVLEEEGYIERASVDPETQLVTYRLTKPLSEY